MEMPFYADAVFWRYFLGYFGRICVVSFRFHSRQRQRREAPRTYWDINIDLAAITFCVKALWLFMVRKIPGSGDFGSNKKYT